MPKDAQLQVRGGFFATESICFRIQTRGDVVMSTLHAV